MLRLALCIVVTASFYSNLFAQKLPAQPEEINPKLPNVLLIGDSISIGYTRPVRKKLSGVANVFRPNTNCGPTTKGVSELDKWLGDRKWSVIHFNHGLHDLKYMGPNNENLADPKDSKSHQQVPPVEYEANLAKIVERLKKTGAVLIWCETTPVPEGAKGRVVGDSRKYNEIAAKVMKKHEGIQINPLWQLSTRNVPTRPANVHYTAEGSDKLASQVASLIKKNLP
jgi:lysophospholipase L1-like esterase